MTNSLRLHLTILAILTIATVPVFGFQSNTTVRLMLYESSSDSEMSEKEQEEEEGKETVPQYDYKNIYNGVDLSTSGDEYSFEHVFTVAPGSDPSQIKFIYDDLELPKLNHGGGVTYQTQNARIVQNPPVVYLKTPTSSKRVEAGLKIENGNQITMDLGDVYQEMLDRNNGSTFNTTAINPDSQKDKYSLHKSNEKVSNEQYINFLNDIERNPKSSKGANTFIDKKGNVSLDAKGSQGANMFSIGQSKVVYDPKKPIGERYGHKLGKSMSTPYSELPAMGVSWIGAAKYCNWLTIHSDRGSSEGCYSEGANLNDWAPSSATNWNTGILDISEQKKWLESKGFRLSMNASEAGESETLLNATSDDDAIKKRAANSEFKKIDTSQGFHVVSTYMPPESFEIRISYDFFHESLEYQAMAGADPQIINKGLGDQLLAGRSAGADDAAAQAAAAAGAATGDQLSGAADGAQTTAPYSTGPVGDGIDSRVGGGVFGPDSDGDRAGTGGDSSTPRDDTRSPGDNNTTDDPFLNPNAETDNISGDSSRDGVGGGRGTGDGGGTFSIVTPDDVRTPGDESDVFHKDIPNVIYSPDIVGDIAANRPPDSRDDSAPPSSGGDDGGGGGKKKKPSGTNTLDIGSINPGAGVFVTMNPIDIDTNGSANTPFTRRYGSNTVVSLTAPYQVGNNVLLQWRRGGTILGTNTLYQFTIVADTFLDVEYQDPVTLDIESSSPNSGVTINASTNGLVAGAGSGATPFANDYLFRQIVTLNASHIIPGGYSFVAWREGFVQITTNNIVALSMTGDRTITAQYTPPPAITVQSLNPNSGVTITATTNGMYSGSGSGVTTFSNRYFNAVPVTLTAPAAGPLGEALFWRWREGGLTLTTNLAYSFVMSIDRTVTAEYHPPLSLTVDSTPNSSVNIGTTVDLDSNNSGTTTFTNRYRYGDGVTLIAPNLSGEYTFFRWMEGAAVLGTNLNLNLVMTIDRNVTAEYHPPPNLTVNSTPNSAVTIATTVDLDSNNSGVTTFTNRYLYGTTASLTAPALAGALTEYVFWRWRDGGVILGTNLSENVSLYADEAITAEYHPPANIAIDSAPNTAVTISTTADVDGNNTGSTTFTNRYRYGDGYTLTAPNISGEYVFWRWREGATILGTNLSVNATALADTTITAEYHPPPNIGVDSTPNAAVTINTTVDLDGNPSGVTAFTNRYQFGAAVTLTAPDPEGDYVFWRWREGATVLGTNLSVNVTALADTTFTAEYRPPPNLGVDSTPNTAVTITTTVDLDGNPSGVTTFTNRYRYGDAVVLTAPSPAGEYVFWRWREGATVLGTNLSVNLTLFANRNITAEYNPPPTLGVESTPNSSVLVTTTVDLDGNPSGSTAFSNRYLYGSSVSLTAPNISGEYVFWRWWQGAAMLGTNLNINVVLNTNTTVTAEYHPPNTVGIESANPNSGVTINTTSDLDAQSSGTTTFSNRYIYGSTATFTAPILGGTNVFEHWIRGVAIVGTNLAVTLGINTNFTLIAKYAPPIPLLINSLYPASGVSITNVSIDTAGATDGTTIFSRSYRPNENVSLTAEATATNGNVFEGWLLDGSSYSLNQTASLQMDTNHTMTAVYAPSMLSNSLAFDRANDTWVGMTPPPDNTLRSTPGGGNPPYQAYEYEYILLHHVWGTPEWQSSSITGAVYTYNWEYSIKYRARVQDTAGIWSDWSNEAFYNIANSPTGAWKTQAGL